MDPTVRYVIDCLTSKEARLYRSLPRLSRVRLRLTLYLRKRDDSLKLGGQLTVEFCSSVVVGAIFSSVCRRKQRSIMTRRGPLPRVNELGLLARSQHNSMIKLYAAAVVRLCAR